MRRAMNCLRSRPRKKLSEWSDRAVSALGVASFAEASLFGWVVKESFAPYWEFALTLPWSQWGAQGLGCTLVLMAILVQVWFYSATAKQCSNVLQRRLFA